MMLATRLLLLNSVAVIVDARAWPLHLAVLGATTVALGIVFATR